MPFIYYWNIWNLWVPGRQEVCWKAVDAGPRQGDLVVLGRGVSARYQLCSAVVKDRADWVCSLDWLETRSMPHHCWSTLQSKAREHAHRNCWRQHAVSGAGYCAGVRHDSYNKSLIVFFALKEAKSHGEGLSRDDPFRSSLVEVCWSRGWGLVYFWKLWTESSPLKMENCPHHCPLDFFTAECRTGGRMSTVTSATCLGIDADVSVIRVNSQ